MTLTADNARSGRRWFIPDERRGRPTVRRGGGAGQGVAGARSRAAFSLVEVLAAALVMAIIFAVLFTGISTTFRLLDTTRENLRATQIAVSRLEELRLCAWSDAQLFNTNVVPPTFTDSFYPLGLKSTTNTGTLYSGTITVATNVTLNPPATYADKLALVTVTVNWTNYSGSRFIPHHCSMNTLIAEYGVQNYIYSH
jgi:type II secretory pathway pseudopilin PulG